MNDVSFNIMKLICKNLPIIDLISLQKTCKKWWLGLKTKKLSCVWHYKYFKHFKRFPNGKKNNSIFQDIFHILDKNIICIRDVEFEEQRKYSTCHGSSSKYIFPGLEGNQWKCVVYYNC